MLGKIERLNVCAKYIGGLQRYLATKAVSDVKTKVKAPKKSKPLAEREIYQHFNTPSRFAALEYPEEFFIKRRNKHADSFYIADEKAAQIVVKEVKKDLQTNKPLIEVNPGIGLLTQLLIDQTQNDLLLYEQEKNLFNKIADIIKNHQNRRISLKQCDLVALWKMGYLDKLDGGNRSDEVFDKIQCQEYEADTVARMFACVGSLKFFKDLILSSVFQNGFLSVGRIEMFLCVPPPVFNRITCSPAAGYFHYRASTVLFQLLFEYEFITKIDRKCFLPWRATPANTPKLGKIMLTDFECMYLIRIQPRRDLFEHCAPEHLTALWFFVKQHLSSRAKTVIPSIERWIPGCGPRLIVNNSKVTKKPEILFPSRDISGLPDYIAQSTTLSTCDFVDNIHIFTQFGTLTPTQILSVFNEFINWREYDSCAFVSSLEKALIKMHTKEENDELSDDESEEATFIEGSAERPKNLGEILSALTSEELGK